MCTIGPDAQAAVPALRECLKDAQRHMQIAAATVLGEIGPAARDAIPDLINALSDIGAASDDTACWQRRLGRRRSLL